MKKLILILLSIPLAAGAFTLNSSTNSDLEGWDGGDVQLLVNTANCPAGIDVPGIIAEAADVWNNVPTSSIKVSYGGSTTSTTFSSPPTVYCEPNFQAVTGGSQNSVPGAGAVQSPGGRISSGLLYLNASAGSANIANYDRTTLVMILAHEIGHILGLGHSESMNALMYYSGSAKTTLRLSQDDIDGISYLYPANELGGDKIAGCGLVQNLNPPTGGGTTGLVLLALVPLLAGFVVREAGRRRPKFHPRFA